MRVKQSVEFGEVVEGHNWVGVVFCMEVHLPKKPVDDEVGFHCPCVMKLVGH